MRRNARWAPLYDARLDTGGREVVRSAFVDELAGALAEEPRTLVLVTHDVEEALVRVQRTRASLAAVSSSTSR